ncbi:MAG: TIGR04255 family protein, partial [Labilithrix sp.]|nr:TIGR04255 family protein [Labilithrix sp.]
PLPPELVQALGSNGGHEFLSADGVWKLSLTRDFLALTTKSYVDWSGFKQQMRIPLEALCELYAPAFFLRVGLRYRDRIDRERLGVQDVPWGQLLRAEAVGELATEALGPHIEHVLRELVVRLANDEGHVRIVHGLQKEGDSAPLYIIDSDFFTEKQTETGGVSNVLDAFNRRAGHLFRWYITPRLHDAMEPRAAPAA